MEAKKKQKKWRIFFLIFGILLMMSALLLAPQSPLKITQEDTENELLSFSEYAYNPSECIYFHNETVDNTTTFYFNDRKIDIETNIIDTINIDCFNGTFVWLSYKSSDSKQNKLLVTRYIDYHNGTLIEDWSGNININKGQLNNLDGINIERYAYDFELRSKIRGKKFGNKNFEIINKTKIKFNKWNINTTIEYNGDEEVIQIQKDESFEFDLKLQSKPDTNKFYFQMKNTDNLDFLYQPPLYEEKGLEQPNATCYDTYCNYDGESWRPENIVGSYAVYHKNLQDNEYQTGKVYHILRPLIIDNEGNTTWGVLYYNETNSKLSITVSQDFLDNATYPVIVDPNFGYETVGGSTLALDGTKCFAHLKAPRIYSADGTETVTSITAYISGSGTMGGAIYTRTGQVAAKTGATGTFTVPTSAAWTTTSALSIGLSNGVDYVSAIGDVSASGLIYYDGDDRGTSQHNVATFQTTWAQNSRPAYKMSLYFTYSSGDSTKPTYSNVGHNNTVVGLATNFYSLWNDDTALNPNGQYIFSTNNTGTWTNDSAVNFTVTPSWANVTKVLNDTITTVGYRWYTDDNAGNTNHTELFKLLTTALPTGCWTQNPTYLHLPTGCAYPQVKGGYTAT